VVPQISKNKNPYQMWPEGWAELTDYVFSCDMISGICECGRNHKYLSKCKVHPVGKLFQMCSACRIGIRDNKTFIVPIYFDLGYEDTWLECKNHNNKPHRNY
jgi:hypothetical protein